MIDDGFGVIPNLRNSEKFTRGRWDAEKAKHASWKEGNQGERGVFSYCDFSDLDLRGEDLSGMNFEYCNFTNADLRETKLYMSSFRGADFTNADLSGVDIVASNFAGATMTNINLYNPVQILCYGNGKEFKNINVHKYNCLYTSAYIQAGCLFNPIDWWKTATKEEVLAADTTMDIDQVYAIIQGLVLPALDLAPAIPVRVENTLG